MALENLFETALSQASLSGLTPRDVGARTSKPGGYLVVGLQTRAFLEISTYHVREITALTREEGKTRYHDNGVVHAVLRGNFNVDAVVAREFCFSGAYSAELALDKLRAARDCGYSFPYDFSALDVTSANGHTSVVIPPDQFVRDTHYRPIMMDYIRRTKAGELVIPCPTVYYTTALPEAQEAVQRLKETSQ